MTVTIRDYRTRYAWRPIQDPAIDPRDAADVQLRLGRILRRWEGTPYMEGQRRCGVATDCRGFVLGVYDEMFGFERPEAFVVFPQDGAMHNRAESKRIADLVTSMYGAERVRDRTLEPGDAVLMAGGGEAGPGHMLIVGVEENHVWHAGRARVTRTGIGFDRIHQRIVAVYRVAERSAWVSQL